jgi:site-specific DNA recombinase
MLAPEHLRQQSLRRSDPVESCQPPFRIVNLDIQTVPGRLSRPSPSPRPPLGPVATFFDDRGNRMTPSHSNRDGVCYRYYVSHVLLQRRKKDAGRVTRVPAIQLEKLVVEAIRAEAQPDTEPKGDLSDRGVIDRYVTRVIARPDSIDIEVREPTAAPAPPTGNPCSGNRRRGGINHRHQLALERASVPLRQRSSASARGQADAQTRNPGRDSPRRSQGTLLDRRCRGCVRSFAEIAAREGKVERHIRLLTPLAFIPPRTLAAIIDGTGPHDATVTALAQAVPYRWDHNPAAQVSEQTPDDGR